MGWDSANNVWRKVLVNDQGKLIIDPSEIFEDPPADGEVGKAPTSNWAHDHNANASAHHARYTDAEALMAWANASLVLTAGTYTSQDVAGKGILVLDTSGGDINLEGLSGGVTGQVIYCHKPHGANALAVLHNSANAATGDRFYTYNDADDTIGAWQRGGFNIIYYDYRWRVERHLNI